MASTDRTSSSSLKRSRWGQMRQVRQKRGRFKIVNLPRHRSLSSFDRGRCGRCGSFFKSSLAHANRRLTLVDTIQLSLAIP